MHGAYDGDDDTVISPKAFGADDTGMQVGPHSTAKYSGSAATRLILVL